MAEAFIFDAVRTPRGKGRLKDGALADVTPVHLARTVLEALPGRLGFSSAEIDDVILGCVEPAGEQETQRRPEDERPAERAGGR